MHQWHANHVAGSHNNMSFVIDYVHPTVDLVCFALPTSRSGACFAKVQCGYSAAAPATLGKATGGFKSVVKTADGATATGIATSNATNKPRASHKPLHDPTQPGAIVLNADECQLGVEAPTSTHGPGNAVPVVIDPYLGRHLRPHQVGIHHVVCCRINALHIDLCSCTHVLQLHQTPED
jgi:hypothetical protein